MSDFATAIPSDVLAQWHTVLRGLPAFANLLGLPKQLHLVIDANVVIAEVRWMVKKRSKQGARTALQEVIASGTVIAYAPPLLRTEVEKRLHSISESEGLPLKELLTAWGSYEPLLRFVEPRSLPDAAKRAAARDPNDAKYFELQVGIDATAIYTDDPDLRGMGAPVVGRPALKAAQHYARAASISFTFRISGVVVLTAGVATINSIAVLLRGGVRTVRRLPDWIQLLLVAGVFVLLMNPSTRAWLRDRLRAIGSQTKEVVRELMPMVAAMMEQTGIATATAQEAWGTVDDHLPKRATMARQPLHVHVLTACIRSSGPLTTEEIAQAVPLQGYRGGATPSRDYLERVLRSHPALMRTADRRWQPRDA